MTLSSILSAATSGLSAAQLGLSTVSDNIANVNTPGYVRKIEEQGSSVAAGQGVGVNSAGVQLAANQFLQNTSLSAAGAASSSSVISNMLSQAQALFGDPTSSTSYFNQLSQIFSGFSTAASDPTSSAAQSQAVSNVSQFLSQSQNISASLNSLNGQADSQIGTDVGQANQLLSQISQLNSSIAQTVGQGGDPTDAQNSQNELLTQLSSLIDVKASTSANGTIALSSTNGTPLVGAPGAATLAYQPATDGAGVLSITPPGGSTTSTFTPASGEIQGLLSLRGTQIPAISDQLSQFVSQTANAINAASNASTAVPAPSQLTGSNIGVDLSTAIGDFSGTTNIAIVNSSGVVQQQVAITFNGASGGSISVNGVSAGGFAPSSFLSSLNSALGTAGTASFNNGVLSIQATASGTGVSIADDPTTPSSHGGVGFSQYFGLNNLINSTGFPNANTGLQASDTSGFTGSITLQVNNPNGARNQDITVTAPAGGTIQNLLTALNSPSTGVGLYGSFSLSSQGALTYTPTNGGSLSVVADNTQWGTGGASISQLFSLGNAQQASLLGSFSVNPAIQSNVGKLPLAQLNLAAASGTTALSPGDGSGGLALANAGSATINFAAAGGAAGTSTTLTNYAAQLSGQIGQNASAAAQASTAATAVQTEATANLQSATGVNLDQELVKLTTYQQAYSSCARLFQASSDIFNALIAVVQ